MNVQGKFVFVGVTANGVMPQIGVPNGLLLEPHKIQTALAESILIEDSPYIPDWALALEILIFIVSVSMIWLVLNAFGVTWGIILAILIMLSTAYTGYGLIHRGILIDVTWSLISQFITGSIALYLRFREQWKLREQIKGQFGTYLSPDMVNMLIEDPSLMKLGGQRTEMTFMFADIVGFTPISEAYMKKDDPEGLELFTKIKSEGVAYSELTNIYGKTVSNLKKIVSEVNTMLKDLVQPCLERSK